MYLLDTDVLSALGKRTRDPRLARWIEGRASDDLFLSVVTIGEIERGIAKQDRVDPAFAVDLAAWLERTTAFYAERILPVTAAIARRWGRLTFDLGRGDADVLIAATALDHGLKVVTRNVRHFAPTGVETVDPSVAAKQ